MSNDLAHLNTEVMRQSILEQYLDGKSLTDILAASNIPRVAFSVWLKDSKDFRTQLDQAREIRAMWHEEAAVQAGTSFPDKDEVAGVRLAAETYWKAAEVNDPSRYGKRTTVAGDPDKPIHFTISTGFPEPNEFQRPPKLGRDGLIEREITDAVVVEGESANAIVTGIEREICGADEQFKCGEVPSSE